MKQTLNPHTTFAVDTFPRRPRLPVEIWERIIDAATAAVAIKTGHQDIDQLYALMSACALVCHTWKTKSRVLLYNRVWLGGAVRTRRLLRTLSDTPSLGRLVKELRLDFLHGYQAQSMDSKKPVYRLDWAYKALCYLPRYLQKLKTLQFWYMPSLQPIFMLHCSQFTTVESLNFQYSSISFLEIVQLVNRLPHLQKLKILECKWRQPVHCYAKKICQLTSLDMDLDDNGLGVIDIMEWLIKSDSISLLTNLDWSLVYPSQISLLNKMLESCKATLQSTRFKLYGNLYQGK